MRRALTVAAVTLAAAALAAPAAHADYPPTDCYTTLVLAATGASSTCITIGAAPVPTGNNRRVANVYVQTGQVSATLGCGADGYHPAVEEHTITVTAPWSGSMTIDRTSFCWLTITATADGTTAIATNLSGRTVD
jgi:FlaG/FlaF family flagellin (archaellin)